MYNYIWVRRPDTGAWERVHNFGTDVRAFRSGTEESVNTIGMNLELRQQGLSMAVTYPFPLIIYRQFDDKVSSPALAARYPDFGKIEMTGLKHADASVRFTFTMDREAASFTLAGHVLDGRVTNVVYIINSLWTENYALPSHVYFEGFPEYDVTGPDGKFSSRVTIENVAYVIFYRADGDGVPYAYLPLSSERAEVENWFDNWKCLRDFRLASQNQKFVPSKDPPVRFCNDTGYCVRPRPDGSLPGVRVAFFPELGWGRGGIGRELRDRIEAAIRDRYADAARAWDRQRKWLVPKIELSHFQPPSEL